MIRNNVTQPIVAWKDFVQGRPQPCDDKQQGTHVAGTICGASEWKPYACVQIPKEANAAKSLRWLLDRQDTLHARIVSLPPTPVSPALQEVLGRAHDAGMMVILAGKSTP